jgi:hypothetical protein
VSYFFIRPPMPGSWGPPPMLYPPWAEWYGLWVLPLMHFHLGWSGPAGGFGHEGYHIGDGRDGGVGQQQTRQKNRIVRNAKPDHPVSLKTTEAPGQPHKQLVWKSEDSWSSGGGGGQPDGG